MSSDVVRWTKQINKTNRKKMFQNKRKKYNLSDIFINHSIFNYLVLFIIVINVNLVLVLGDEVLDAPGARGHYTPTWAVHIVNGDNGAADRVAAEHGFRNLGKVSFLTNF